MRFSFDLTGAALHPLCPTRWTAKAKLFEPVFQNCEALLETLHAGDDEVTCLEVINIASGIHAELETFDLFLPQRFAPSLCISRSAEYNLTVH